MFKNVFLCLALFVATLSYSQIQQKENTTKMSQTVLTNVDIVVEVDSAEDIEKTFNVEDIKKILNESEENEAITFEIICKGDVMSNGTDSKMTYKVEGNTSQPKEFLNLISKVKKSAIKYYTNKN